ncbi:TonB-dependent receptor [Neolewinella antarctica]|uniref:Outer membrane receptor protein involved in Fe transport n=1 Tax=Neolewinella antarctica TaxID=442734 RepID=A0ABX0X978_9BACT|nr:TonB-dependent receptor [Neolewinella antarctica]NJC25337.1 outer membrane receptor protein involved in Fe transport [Neolewinella antarctica]
MFKIIANCQLRWHPRPRILPLFILLCLPFFALAQVQGKVVDADDYPLAGATVTWGDGTGTTVELDGSFTLPEVAGQHHFTISYLGFTPQSFHVGELNLPLTVILLEAASTLGDVTVTARDNGNSASVLKTRNIESISSKELRKAPCCSLAESFENSAVVDLTYGDPLTGRREIQMLGLRGNYTQITLEKRPMLDGLASPYALDLIPGPWVQGIQIGKGSGSLESGAQGMTGEINTELIKPVNGPKLYLNAFAGSQGRGEINVLGNKQIAENLYLGGAAHGSFTGGNQDFDDDGFRDMPNRQTGVGMVRLFKNGGGNWEGQWNALGAYDRREGGQTDLPGGRPDGYQINQDNRRFEVWGKTGFFGFNKPHQSLGTIYSASFHQLENVYGEKRHRGEQQSFYFNGLYQTRIANDQHLVTTGITARSDRFDEFLNEQDFSRGENTVGAFGEYTFNWEEDRTGAPYRAFTAIVGLRVEEHNLGGTQISPRLNLKYNPSEQFAVRASAGRGWRSPNLLVDNLNWLPSSRRVTLDRRESIDADGAGFIGLEKAWNYGTNVTGHVDVGDRELEFVLDAYRTVFTDQIIVDAEQDFRTLRLYQLDGVSRANSLLASLNYEIFPLVDVKLAYKYNDVKQTYREGGLREVPLTPKHRYLATIGYDGARIKAHLNYQYVGEQRLIDFGNLPATVEVTQPQRSPGFGLLSAQFTYVANAKTELYFGGENLTNNRQANAVIGADAPLTGDYFDATQVYKPIFGTMAFIGVRYTVE